MADFKKLFDKLEKDAEQRDTCTAKEKCPKKRKPAIFVLVARADNAEPVSGVDVDVSKPTKQKKSTGGDGTAKFDPAKLGGHVVRFNLSPELAKKYSPLASREVSTTEEKTTTLLVMLAPMPSLQVVVERSDTHEVIPGAKVGLTGPEPLNGSTAPGSGMANFDRLKPGRYDAKITLTEEQLKTLQAPVSVKKSVIAGQSNLLKVLVRPRGKVDPTIAIADPKVVLVKRPYMDKPETLVKPKRLPVKVGVTAAFDGTGRLTCNLPNKIKLYDADENGNELKLPLSVSGSQLSPTYTLYIEGAEPSGKLTDVELNLELQGGTATLGAPVKDKLTVVRVQLDIHQYKTSASTPAKLSTDDKTGKGSTLHKYARTMLVVNKAEPKEFQGKLVLKPINATVKVFDADREGTEQATPFTAANGTIPDDGKKFWTEGAAISGADKDTGFTLGVEDVGEEGDRVVITVKPVKITPKKAAYTVILTKAGAASGTHPLLEFDIEGPPNWICDVQLSRENGSTLTAGPGLAGAWDKAKEPKDRIGQALFSNWTNGEKAVKLDGSGKGTYKIPLDWWKDQARRPRTDFSTVDLYYRVVVIPDEPASSIGYSAKKDETPPKLELRNNLLTFTFTNSGYIKDDVEKKAKNPVSFKYTVREANTADMYTFVQWKKGSVQYTAVNGTVTYGQVRDYNILHLANMTEWSIDRLQTNPRYHNGPSIGGGGTEGSSEDAPTAQMRGAVVTRRYDFDTRVHLDFDVPASVTITKQVGAGEPYDEVIGKLADPQPLTVDNYLWTCSIVLTKQIDGSYVMTNP